MNRDVLLILRSNNSSRRFKGLLPATLGVVLLSFLPWLVSTADAGETDIEQRIQRIQNGLLPPVLVRGEPVSSSKLTDRMQALHVPGVSVAVIHGGRIEWARGFGVTKIGGPPVTPETLFQAASLSKPVSALAALHLAQSNKLDLDTDVNTYLKTWQLPGNEFTDKTKVTLRLLLSHSAGMTVHGFPGYAAGEPIPSLTQILNGEPPANTPPIRVDTLPGSKWRYSGGGYVVAQQALSDVMGMPFPKLMQNLVLKPLGMKHSTYAQPLPAPLLARAATPYLSSGRPVKGGPHVYPELAPAGLWTTPSDIARFALGVQQALAGKSTRVLSVTSAREMLKPGLNHWGLGPEIGGSTEHPYFSHGGANEGFRSYFVAYHDGDGAVLMTNSNAGSKLQAEIIRTIAHEYGWPDFAPVERVLSKLKADEFDRCAGAYQTPAGDVAMFWREGDRVYHRNKGSVVDEMFPTSEHEYFVRTQDARYVFNAEAGVSASAVTLYEEGRAETAKRLDDAQARPLLEESSQIARRFREQKPDPLSEAAARGLISGLVKGAPDYEKMTAGFAALNRQALPQMRPFLARFGPVKSFTFQSVGPDGADIYNVECENDSFGLQVVMTTDGLISSARFSP